MTISVKEMSSNPQESLGSLEQEALKRKERLKALKRKAENSEATSSKDDDEATSSLKKDQKPQFRSYKPIDESIIEENNVKTGKIIDIADEVQTQLELLKTPMIIDEIDIANLAPRKPDWDLKRDVAKKLEKLEKRTQRCIAELIRDRLKNNQQDNILQAVNVGSTITASSSAIQSDDD